MGSGPKWIIKITPLSEIPRISVGLDCGLGKTKWEKHPAVGDPVKGRILLAASAHLLYAALCVGRHACLCVCACVWLSICLSFPSDAGPMQCLYLAVDAGAVLAWKSHLTALCLICFLISLSLSRLLCTMLFPSIYWTWSNMTFIIICTEINTICLSNKYKTFLNSIKLTVVFNIWSKSSSDLKLNSTLQG